MSAPLLLQDIEPRLLTMERTGSSVTERAFVLSKKCVSDLNHAEIAFCLRQNLARNHILPPALEILDKNPLIEVEFYEGDLLVAVLTAAKDQRLTAEQLSVLVSACSEAQAVIETLVENVLPELRTFTEVQEQ